MKTDIALRQQPLFIVLEGIDGSGKSTSAALLAETLEKMNITSVLLSEPTKGRKGKRIRNLLASADPDNSTLLELFISDRLEDIEKNIRPALADNSIVILDRYYYSNAAYQSESVKEAHEIAEKNRSHNMPEPDRIYFLSLSPGNAMARISARTSASERECFETVERLSHIAQRYEAVLPESTVHIDAMQKSTSIVEAILRDIHEFQQLKREHSW